MSRDNLSIYPYFIESFKIHTNASGFQLGLDTSQKVKPIAFNGRKLTDAQQWYTVTEIEPLIAVESLKEFKTILIGQKLIIYTAYKNLTCKI